MRWRLGDLGEASALDSRESSAFRTPLVTLEAAGLKQFDGPHFFCNGGEVSMTFLLLLFLRLLQLKDIRFAKEKH